MPYCTQCGNSNPDSANYCARCGSELTKPADLTQAVEPGGDTTSALPVVGDEVSASGRELSPEDVAAVEALPTGHALLIVQRGPSAGARFLLDSDEITAGRHPDSDIFLDDITVSRHHVRFTRSARGTTVGDVGSLNGTYVNRTLIDGEILLRPGDEVQIGKFRMVYFASAPASD